MVISIVFNHRLPQIYFIASTNFCSPSGFSKWRRHSKSLSTWQNYPCETEIKLNAWNQQNIKFVPIKTMNVWCFHVFIHCLLQFVRLSASTQNKFCACIQFEVEKFSIEMVYCVLFCSFECMRYSTKMYTLRRLAPWWFEKLEWFRPILPTLDRWLFLKKDLIFNFWV